MSFKVPDRLEDVETECCTEYTAASTTDVVGLLKSCRSLNIAVSSNTFSQVAVFIRNFDSSKHEAHPVVAILDDHITADLEVLENDGASYDDKENAFEAVKVATCMLCWLCQAVNIDAVDSTKGRRSKSETGSSKKPSNTAAVWKTTLGVLHQVVELDLGLFQRSEHYTDSLLHYCLRQANIGARSHAIKDKGCVAPLASIFIALARKHNLLEEVTTVLTRLLYDIDDSVIVHFLARDLCEKCFDRQSFPKLPEAILEDMLEKRRPEDYIRLSNMGSRVAEFLNCASDSCAELVRQKFLFCLERHLSHGIPEMRSAIITLMGYMIKLSSDGMDKSSDASLAMRVTNWSLMRQIMIKHEDENARTRVRVIQTLDMLVEYSKFSDATLGTSSSEALFKLAEILHHRIDDVKPTVRRAAMKLTQTVVARNPIWYNLDLQSAQDRKNNACHQLEDLQKAADAHKMLLHYNHGNEERSQFTLGEPDQAADGIHGQENVSSVANVGHQISDTSMHDDMERAKIQADNATLAVSLILALHKCVIYLEALLKSAESSDVVESITTLKLMRSVGIQPASECIGNALQLATQPTQKAEVVTTVIDMFESLYLSHDSEQQNSAQQNSAKLTATALVELLNTRPGEDMERTMSCCLGIAMGEKGSFKNYTAVANELFDLVMRLTLHLPSDDTVLPPTILHLRVLHAIALHKPNVCSGKVPELLSIAQKFPQSRYAFLQLMVMRLLFVMFDNPSTRNEVNRTEVLKVVARHLIGPHVDSKSVMLMKESLRGMFVIDKSNPLRLMRLVCQSNARIAAAALQKQMIHASVHTSREDLAASAANRTGSHDALDLVAGHCETVANEQCGDIVGNTCPMKAHDGDIVEDCQDERELHSSTAVSTREWSAPADTLDTMRSRKSTPVNCDRCQASLGAALISVGETALMHKHVIDIRMDQAEAIQATDHAAAEQATQKQKDSSDTSLVACVQTLKENLELERERLEDYVHRRLRPMMAMVTTLCRSKALFRTNGTLRATALLALMKLMCAYKTVCEEDMCLQLLFSCVSARYRDTIDPGLQLTLMAGTADLLNRWANTLDPWTDRFFCFLDDHIQPQKHGIRILTKLILSAMLKPTGKIYRVCYCLVHEDSEIEKAAKNLFKECASKKTDQGGNLVYNLLPDIISNLMWDPRMIDQPEKFVNIMRILLGHVKEDKHHAALVGTLMDRMLQQTQDDSAVLLLKCFDLLKGMAACKQILHLVQQQLPRLKRLLYNKVFADKLQGVLKKANASLKRNGKPEDKDEGVAVIEVVEGEINAILADGQATSLL